MGLFSWIRSLFRKSPAPPDGSDPFLDPEAGRIVHVPVSELQPGPIQHGPFDEEVRDLLREMQSTFAEHYNLTLEEWEDGFRRDINPEREIAIWLHAGKVYRHFGADEPSPKRRQEVFAVILSCMNSGESAVWQVLKPAALSKTETEQIVRRFFHWNESV